MSAHVRSAAEARLPIGSAAPEFRRFEQRSLNGSGRPVMPGGKIILFLSTTCSVCNDLSGSIGQTPKNQLPQIIAFCEGKQENCERYRSKLRANTNFLVDADGQIAEEYRVSGFPTAVVVDDGQVIRGYGHPKDVDSLRKLFLDSLNGDVDTIPQDIGWSANAAASR